MREVSVGAASLLTFLLSLAPGCASPVVLSVDDTAGGSGGGEVAGGGEDGGDEGGDEGDEGGEEGGEEGGGDDGGGSEGYPSINEFMASNATTIQDDSGEYADWIELYNPTSEDWDLDGWYISDDLDEPDKHELKDLSIPAGGFLLLWADGDTDEGDEHLSFGLNGDGEAIGLYDSDGRAMDRLEYEPQVTDVSAARTPDGSTSWSLTDEPTPGESNGSGE